MNRQNHFVLQLPHIFTTSHLVFRFVLVFKRFKFRTFSVTFKLLRMNFMAVLNCRYLVTIGKYISVQDVIMFHAT